MRTSGKHSCWRGSHSVMIWVSGPSAWWWFWNRLTIVLGTSQCLGQFAHVGMTRDRSRKCNVATGQEVPFHGSAAPVRGNLCIATACRGSWCKWCKIPPARRRRQLRFWYFKCVAIAPTHIPRNNIVRTVIQVLPRQPSGWCTWSTAWSCLWEPCTWALAIACVFVAARHDACPAHSLGTRTSRWWSCCWQQDGNSGPGTCPRTRCYCPNETVVAWGEVECQ